MVTRTSSGAWMSYIGSGGKPMTTALALTSVTLGAVTSSIAFRPPDSA